MGVHHAKVHHCGVRLANSLLKDPVHCQFQILLCGDLKVCDLFSYLLIPFRRQSVVDCADTPQNRKDLCIQDVLRVGGDLAGPNGCVLCGDGCPSSRPGDGLSSTDLSQWELPRL